MDRFGSDPAVAVLTWASVRLVQRRLHHLGGHQRRIQTHRSRRSGQTLGWTQIQTQHELRQTQPRFTVCLYFIVYVVYKPRHTRTSSPPLWSGLIYNCHPSYSVHLPPFFFLKGEQGNPHSVCKKKRDIFHGKEMILIFPYVKLLYFLFSFIYYYKDIFHFDIAWRR